MTDQDALAFYDRLDRVRTEVEQIQLRTPGRPLDQRIKDTARQLAQVERDLSRLAGPHRLPLQQFLQLLRNALDDARGPAITSHPKLRLR